MDPIQANEDYLMPFRRSKLLVFVQGHS